MMKNGLLASLMALCLFGCTSKEEARLLTQDNFNSPEFVGDIRGQKLYRAKVVMPRGNNSHWVYFFDSNPVVTVNHNVPNGKAQINHVEVFLNGRAVLSTNLAENQ